MKKGFTCLLFTFILIAAPSAIKAQGLTRTINNLTTNLLSTQQVSNNPSPTDTILSITSQVLSPLDPKNSDASAGLQSVVTQVINSVPLVSTTVEQPQAPITSNSTASPQVSQPAQQPVSVNPGTAANSSGVTSSTPTSSPSTNQNSGVNLGVNLPVVGNVNVNVLPGKNPAEQPGSTGSLAGLQVTNSPLLGNVNLGVLPVGNLAGLQVTNSPLLGNVNLGVLPAGSLAGLEITNSQLLGNLNLEVMPADNLAGLVITNSPLLGDLNVAVLPNGVGTNSNGLLTIDSNNLLGNLNLGIGDNQNNQGGLIELVDSLVGSVNSTLSEVMNNVTQDIDLGLIQIDLDLPLLENPIIVDIFNPQKDTTDGSGNSPPGDATNGGNGSTVSNPPVTVPTESIPNIPNPSKQEDQNTGDAVNPKEITNPEMAVAGLNADEQSSFNADVILETEKNSFTDVIGHLTRQSQTELESVSSCVGNDTANLPLQIESPTSTSTSAGSSSGSSAGGSSSVSGGSGMSAYFGYDHFNELALSNKVQFTLNELTDKWTKVPLIQPPKSFFFLSV